MFYCKFGFPFWKDRFVESLVSLVKWLLCTESVFLGHDCFAEGVFILKRLLFRVYFPVGRTALQKLFSFWMTALQRVFYYFGMSVLQRMFSIWNDCLVEDIFHFEKLLINSGKTALQRVLLLLFLAILSFLFEVTSVLYTVLFNTAQFGCVRKDLAHPDAYSSSHTVWLNYAWWFCCEMSITEAAWLCLLQVGCWCKVWIHVVILMCQPLILHVTIVFQAPAQTASQGTGDALRRRH